MMFEKPTLLSFAHICMRTERITSKLRSPALVSYRTTGRGSVGATFQLGAMFRVGRCGGVLGNDACTTCTVLNTLLDKFSSGERALSHTAALATGSITVGCLSQTFALVLSTPRGLAVIRGWPADRLKSVLFTPN